MKQGLDNSDVARILKRLDKIEESMRAIREFLENKECHVNHAEEDLNSVPKVAGYPIIQEKDIEHPLIAGSKVVEVKRLEIKGNRRTRAYRISMVTDQLNSKK